MSQATSSERDSNYPASVNGDLRIERAHRTSANGLPLLLDSFDPAGCVVVALPGDDSARAMEKSLLALGLPADDIDRLPAADMNRWLISILLHAGRAPNLAAEIRELRDFYIHALDGCGWLVVRARNSQREALVREEAARAGARSTTRYAPALVARH